VVVLVVVVVVVVVVYLPVCLSVYLQSASLKAKQFCETLQLLNLITSKRTQFCETSSIFEVGDIKNEALLRDFLNF